MAKVTLSDIANIKDVSAAATINDNSDKIATALENTLSRDGTSPNQMEAALDMNSNRILNLPTPSDPLDVIRLRDFDDFIAIVGEKRFATNGEALAGTSTNTIMSPALTKSVVDAFNGTLGTAAFKNIGTLGNVVPVLDDNNTWSRQQIVQGSIFSTGAVTDGLPASAAGFDFSSGGSTARIYVVGPDTSTNGQIQLISYNSNATNPKVGLTVLSNGALQFNSYSASAGLLALDSSKNVLGRTLTGTANEVTVANGNGSAGNPTISIPNALTLTGKTMTGGTFTGGAFNGTLGATTPAAAVVTTLLASGLFTSNGQIKFPSTQNPSTDLNTLDDYREGTWSPDFAWSGGTTSLAYTSSGYYIKIGKFVALWAKVTLSAKGSSTGAATIGNIPFPSNSAYPAGAAIGYHAPFTGLTGAIHMSLNAAATDRFSLLQTSSTGSAVLTDTVFNNTSRIDFLAFYVAPA